MREREGFLIRGAPGIKKKKYKEEAMYIGKKLREKKPSVLIPLRGER